MGRHGAPWNDARAIIRGRHGIIRGRHGMTPVRLSGGRHGITAGAMHSRPDDQKTHRGQLPPVRVCRDQSLA
jgi:hypothetical protein